MFIYNSSKELIGYLINILRLYKRIWSIKKGYIFNSILMVFFRSIHPFNSIFFLKIIVDELTAEARFEYAAFYAILFCLIELVIRSLNSILWTYEQKKIIEFKTEFIKEINSKTMSLPYEKMEDSKLLDDKQKALEIFYPRQAHFMDLKNTLIDSKQLIAFIVQLLGVLVIMLTLTPYVFLILLSTYFLSILLNTIASNKEFNVWSNSLVNIGRRIGYFQEISTDYTYAREMRINKLGQWVVDKIYYYFNNMKKDVTNSVRVFTLISMAASTLQIIVNSSVYFYLGYLAYQSTISLSELIVYVNSLGVFILALTGITTCIISLQKAGMHLSTYFNYVKELTTSPEYSNNSSGLINNESFTIEFVHVWFKYPNQDTYTISNLNLKISSNEKLAIVGENGAGKTTLIKLLLRLYTPTKGSIFINGVDIKELDMEEYTNQISAIFQDFNIINFSLLENLAFDKDLKEDYLSEVLNDLEIGKVIKNLPQGLHTEIGRLFNKDGVELSGGQKQKIAIARALLKNSNLIILDEPTAMLSPKAEYDIYTNFSQLTKDKTTIYISHRMSSCRFCDRIVVLDKGEIVELGNHTGLMDLKGVYYNLFIKQAEFYEKISDDDISSIS
ncbi:ABC transporter ATP-binding protein (plasmid) [Alkalihalophilus pseudofirmus]|uniref:ABC transporter ATP-binding protein n=1 Tax=Alkalihalophilus pseudofirmus TaxID=79885 RepID=UPI00259B7B6F|nr:ABC transporter ATP-binding protein [Alkalihalophilus pseudofirmus]WEG19170.1 ABC transporter ATP-binding protein [Alkalihalophilus pseudofirmus]